MGANVAIFKIPEKQIAKKLTKKPSNGFLDGFSVLTFCNFYAFIVCHFVSAQSSRYIIDVYKTKVLIAKICTAPCLPLV